MTTYTTLINTQAINRNLGNPSWVLVDCRFALTDTEKGRRAYQASHIPGAVYAHLNEDLSGTIIAGKTGRHPLPSIEDCERRFSDWGIGPDSQVVVYDDSHGGIAARLWWMLRWLGHEAVAVLDGGWAAWLAEGYPKEDRIVKPASRKFIANPDHSLLVDVKAVEQMSLKRENGLIDARASERYQGKEEPIDPVAGHIPGAINLPFSENVDTNGKWKSKEELRARFDKVLQNRKAEELVFYCGSGVTACHDLLAFKHADLGEARLYAGSWSDWITDKSRQVEANK